MSERINTLRVLPFVRQQAFDLNSDCHFDSSIFPKYQDENCFLVILVELNSSEIQPSLRYDLKTNTGFSASFVHQYKVPA